MWIVSICHRLFYAKRVLFDAFVCHASEDKDRFVRPLVDRLRNEHVEIWYDEFSLEIGDSLRRSIDRGLGQSRFGIIVLSPHFFQKKWSQWELDGLVARQNDTVANVILPVWHGVGRDEVIAYSPSLADKLAASSAEGIDEVARRLLRVIRPHSSTLVIARNHLLGWGYKPPVISDDWWLDVAASAESNDMEGDFQGDGLGAMGIPSTAVVQSAIGAWPSNGAGCGADGLAARGRGAIHHPNHSSQGCPRFHPVAAYPRRHVPCLPPIPHCLRATADDPGLRRTLRGRN